ncbi:NINE protein [Kordiimonas sp. SCSIO 12603]|uniref:NINE protein n=1 Tax=Kordiimonas sp. SCSIO 12603 TaxID=2829596 RepID=UPI00210605FA|nr:NINE protein [Kordiimonas sp. SCSIO 12603]UTW58573.1 NINE protein [Kordiimonas sp. SCSIO 12603]
MLESLTPIIEWLKEYGDVLGGIAAIFAITTVALTNGKIIMQRMRGETPTQALGIAPNAGSTALATGVRDTSFIDAPGPSPEFGGKTAIAILPIKEIGDIQEHFSDGLIEELLADLQKAKLATPEKNTVAQLASQGLGPQEIARTLSVGYVLSTSVRMQDDKIRVSAQLVDHSGANIWSDRFTAVGDDLFAIQESIAAKIVARISQELKPTQVGKNPETGRSYTTQKEALYATSSPKNRSVALILCFLIGIFGIHRFYVRRPFTGFLYLITIGFLGIGFLIDLVLILFGVFTDGKGRPVRLWAPDPLLTKQHHA